MFIILNTSLSIYNSISDGFIYESYHYIFVIALFSFQSNVNSIFFLIEVQNNQGNKVIQLLCCVTGKGREAPGLMSCSETCKCKWRCLDWRMPRASSSC